ncbi:MAG TPA: tetratricopeptide repeat protein [Vicinamibacterales bacterium]|jgi:cytochrome c-type biogenesis protein CcmH/NrfG
MRIVIVSLALGVSIACSRGSFDGFMASGDRYVSARKFAEAAIEYENAARLDGRSAQVQVKLGEAYLALEQPANAAAAFEEACQLDQHDTAVCLRAASQLLATGQFDRAMAPARAVLAVDRFNLDAQLILASALAGTRRFADAEERLEAVLAVSPSDARVYNALGDVQSQRGHSQAAEASYRHAVQLDPISPAPRVSLAKLLFDSRRAADGEKELKAALAANPDDVDANRAYASYLVGTDRCEDAESYWKKAAMESNDVEDWLSLADYYVWSSRPDDALKVLAEVGTRDTTGAVRARTASILYDRGDHDKASTMVDELLDRDPSNVSGLLLRARMAIDAHDTARARDYAHRAATIAPNDAAVRDMLATLSESEQ